VQEGKECRAVSISPEGTAVRRGQRITCKGAPFGCLAPSQLMGYLTAGVVSNCTNEVRSTPPPRGSQPADGVSLSGVGVKLHH